MTAKLIAIRAECPLGHLIVDTKPEFSSSYSDCELCGSHGDTTANVRCDSCEKNYDVILEAR